MIDRKNDVDKNKKINYDLRSLMTKEPATARELTPADYNPRFISEKRQGQLSKSMSKFGDLNGITYNRRTGRLVGGHQRIKYLLPNAKIKKQPAQDESGTVAIGIIISGKSSWAYREVDWDETTEKAANIAANAAGGSFDEEMLRGLVLELDKSGFEMDLLNLASLEDILDGKLKEEKAEDEIPSVGGKLRSRRGDVWILGDHRVMCGDGTSREDVQKLMGHETAAMVFTDPPYGVSYEGGVGKDWDIIKGDAKKDEELRALVTGALKQAAHFTTEDAAFYIWHASSTRREFDDAIRDAGLVERQYLIWAKNTIQMGRADYQWAHEPCYYASKEGKSPAWYGGRARHSVWRATLRKRDGLATVLGQAIVVSTPEGQSLALVPRLPKGKKARTAVLREGETLRVETSGNSSTIIEVGRDSDYVHPTQKPVELARVAIINSTRSGEIVLDLFGGSGTTMMGCEALGRKARLMELEQKYVDVEVKRWEDATGRKAVKEDR